MLPADANGKLVADGVRLVELGPVLRMVSNKVGNVVQTIDELGSETINRYDDLDRLINVYEPVRDPTVTPHRPTPTNNNSSTFGWTLHSDASAYGGDYLRANSGGAADSYMSVSLPADSASRSFAVLATWAPHANNINSAYFRVEDPSGNVLGS